MATLDRLVPPQAPARLGESWSPRRAIAAALVVAAAIAVLQIFQSSGFASTGKAMQQLEFERDNLTARIHQLEAEVAVLSSLERTERVARERLGMVPAKNVVYVTVPLSAPDAPLLQRPIVAPAAYETDAPIALWERFARAVPLLGQLVR
jgi:cell division protein FtsL